MQQFLFGFLICAISFSAWSNALTAPRLAPLSYQVSAQDALAKWKPAPSDARVVVVRTAHPLRQAVEVRHPFGTRYQMILHDHKPHPRAEGNPGLERAARWQLLAW